MTEPIPEDYYLKPIEPDQATKDLIKDEAEQWFKNLPWMESYKFQLVKEGYIAGATVWAEKLKQERNKAQELYNYIENVTKGTIHQHSPHTQDLLRYLKDKSHE